MNQKIKTQKGFIHIPLLIGIIISIIAAVGIGYGTIEYNETSKIIREAEQLTKEEKYNEAIAKLEPAQNKLFGKMIFKQKISNELDTNKKLLEDQSEYTQGIEEFSKENWEKAKDLFSKVSETSPYYQEAKNKIEEAQKKLTEKQIAEARKEILEEAQRKIAEEEAKRIAAEAQLKLERQLTQQQIAELQQKRQEAEEQWIEAEKKRALEEEVFRIGHLLQNYYEEIRDSRGIGKNWWLSGNYQDEVNFASYLAQHGIAQTYWPEYETQYHSLTGSYSYLDAKERLSNAVFVSYAAGVNYYEDSDYEKIRKILEFFKFHIRYEPDFNQLLRAPAETLGLKSGDCDDWSILVSAAFAITGIDSAIMFVVNKDSTEAHAMVLFQSEEILPGLYYYDDLTSYGLPSGEWYIVEPQYTLEEHQQNPDWFEEWDIVAAALVGKIGSSTESKENWAESLWCNGQYWSSCPPGQKFHCPKTGNPFCYSADAIVCNDKIWSPCPTGQKFICPLVGDPYCVE